MSKIINSILDAYHRCNFSPPVKTGFFIILAALITGLAAPIVTHLLKSSGRTEQIAPQISTTEPKNSELNDAYLYMDKVILSLSYAKDVKKSLSESPLTGEEPAFYMQAMTDMRIAMNKLKTAQGLLQEYLNSENQYLQTSAKGFMSAYQGLVTALDGNISILELMANTTPQDLASQEGTIANEASKNLAKADESWKLLTYATIAGTYALVDNERKEGDKKPYLTITTAEKNTLLKKLESYFGDVPKQLGGKGNLHATDASASALWEFFNQPWKPSDSEIAIN